MKKLAEKFYNILFEPVETFRNFNAEKPYKLPLVLVLLASILFSLIFAEDNFQWTSLFDLVSKGVSLIIYWLFFAFFVDLMARGFGLGGKYSKLLTLTSLSFIPWIFLAPLKLLKNTAIFPSEIAVLMVFAVWIWSIVLQILAVSETYSLPRKNAIIIFLIPFFGGILYLTWLIDFFVKIFQISTL